MSVGPEIEDELRHILMKSLNDQKARFSQEGVDGLLAFEVSQFAAWLVKKYAEESGKFSP